MAGNEYSPTLLVTVSRETPLPSLTSATDAPGITPWASLTTPRAPPWDDCAIRCVGYAERRTAASRNLSAVESVRICTLRSSNREQGSPMREVVALSLCDRERKAEGGKGPAPPALAIYEFLVRTRTGA